MTIMPRLDLGPMPQQIPDVSGLRRRGILDTIGGALKTAGANYMAMPRDQRFMMGAGMFTDGVAGMAQGYAAGAEMADMAAQRKRRGILDTRADAEWEAKKAAEAQRQADIAAMTGGDETARRAAAIRLAPNVAAEQALKPPEAQQPKTVVVGKTLLGIGKDGRPTVLYSDPDKVGADGMPSLSEARQWANGYNDDVDAYNKDLGILRPALPYAQQVVRSNGNPGGNFRMNDVALLRAAARAQTGPGVLMESEVFGTLSPSLRQALQNRVAYVDMKEGTITPKDRIALAEYVLQGGSQTSGDIWRRYESTTTPLRQRGVDPESVGVLGPEMIHPDDMPSFLGQPLENFRVGQGYTGPSGRRYIYQGQGRFRFANQNQYNPSLAMDGKGARPGAKPDLSRASDEEILARLRGAN